jgi:hypothetical protein
MITVKTKTKPVKSWTIDYGTVEDMRDFIDLFARDEHMTSLYVFDADGSHLIYNGKPGIYKQLEVVEDQIEQAAQPRDDDF